MISLVMAMETKIINDRATRGKCYGFVTFTNPRSAIDAMEEMNGRVYRDRTRDYDQERERRHEHVYNHDQARNGLFDRDQDQDRGLGVADLEHSRIRNPSWEREHVLDPDGDREMDRTNGHHDKLVEMDRDQNSRKWNGSNNTNQHGREYISNSNDQHGRDYPSNSNDDSDDQAEEQVQESMHRLDELKKEKLEEALINAKKTSAYRKTQLAKLHRSFQQVQEYNERRKSCEKELQSLVDAAMLEEDINNDALWDGILANGNA
ncbi:hypothetical protein TIFTF001_019605 [Ficus carica]|uniref:RRM domain-containing protein n=1 Tax=Ficus carica TaxID=3494 RepID=A0AA88A6U8_FICCA|nr:hypothetical protein TIFTF001_019605 [Ficus carica]